MPARKKSSDTPKEAAPGKKAAAGGRRTTKKAAPAAGEQAPLAKEPRRRATAPAGGSGKNLVIVESPAKAKTIQKYLGPEFEVAASYGHIRDLPPKPRGKNIGIDIEAGWVPTYINLEDDRHRQVLADLKKRSARAGLVYLAPDPDREGEAIAWHLKEALKLDDERIRRITFNEITKRAVQEAIAHPGQIDMDRVKAQEARRFLDRAVGYKLSPLLRKKVARGLSAGRVQSVAVRLIVEREREIEKFQSEEYWRILAHLTPDQASGTSRVDLQVIKKALEEKKPAAEDHPEDDHKPETPTLKGETGKSFVAELAEWDGRKFDPKNEADAVAIGKALESAAYVVGRVEQKDRQEKAPPPFTTSTLQQQANIRHGLPAERTMKFAQQLYEGLELGSEGSVALITYMRTDSTRVSDDALKACREHIQSRYGDKYLPERPNYFASGKSAQEAHEAIRPTDLAYTPERVAPFMPSEGHRKVYELIYRRFVASQMNPAVFAVTNVEVQADKGLFKAQGKILKFDGYRRVLAPRGKQEDATLPHLEEKQPVYPLDLQATQHFTQPPPRYNEASLVKALEKEGIGRPSTYASIIHKIQERQYVEQKNRRFYATEMGKVVTDKLVQHFPRVMDPKFTSQMEEELDQIEERKAEWKQVLDAFWEPFSQALDVAQKEMGSVKNEETGENCPVCGKPLVYRFSTKAKKGQKFAGCSGYPECKFIKREGEEGYVPVETEHKCPTCGKSMMRRMADRGPFLGCSGYPECKTTMNLDAEGNPVLTAKPTGHTCSKCGSPMVLREGRRGPFLGCSAYPKCRNIVDADAEGNPVQPADLGVRCEKCQAPMALKRGFRGSFLGCTAYPKCRSTKPLTAELREQLKDKLPPEKPKAEAPTVEVNVNCPNCSKPMKLRRGRGSHFLGCSGYPKCKTTMEVPPELQERLQAAAVS